MYIPRVVNLDVGGDTMKRTGALSVVGLLLLTQAGCGTCFNLWDSPQGPLFLGSGNTYPFGGVVRSGLLATLGTTSGIGSLGVGSFSIVTGDFAGGGEMLGYGFMMTAAGIGAIADTPISLAGDLLTWPIAYARQREHPWATWWGRDSVNLLPQSHVPIRTADDERTMPPGESK